MALWTCAGCSTHYAVGLPACPQCAGTDHHEEGVMPKITIHGGPTNDAAPRRMEWVSEQGPELIRLPGGATVLPSTEEEPSPGTSSETSPSKPSSSAKQSSSEVPSPARTTASPSKRRRTAASSAASTDGDPTPAIDAKEQA